MRFLIGIIFFFIFPVTTFSQIISVDFKESAALQGRRMDFVIKLKSTWTNPYLQEDIKLDMEIYTASGEVLLQPCFYVKGQSGDISEWNARFSPRQHGDYHFKFVLSKNGKIVATSRKFDARVRETAEKGFLSVKNNWSLQFDNGTSFRGIAENICWESRRKDDSKYYAALHQNASVYNYDRMLAEFAENGGNFFRTWICPWNLPIDFQDGFNNDRYQSDPAHFNSSAVRRLDHLVDLADSLDLYVMLTLGMGNFRSDNIGGVKTTDEFFAAEEAKTLYKNRLRYIVSRWGYSPHIAMWEFLNEVDNIQFNGREKPISSKAIVEWHTEMATYLKKIDPYKHIVTTSISHRDIPGLNDIEAIDINQKHIYKHTDLIPSEINAYSTKHKKPYVIGEFGYEWDWQQNFDDFAYEMELDFKRGLWYGLFSSTPILPMSWWWEYFQNRDMLPYYRGVRQLSDRMLLNGKGEFKPLALKAGRLEAYGVKCGEELYIYLYNPTNEVFSSSVEILDIIGNKKEIQSFDPLTLKYQAEELKDHQDGKILLKDLFVGSKKEKLYIIK